MILSRRKRLRKITIDRLRERTAWTNEFKFVEETVDQQIESEYKYFQLIKNENEILLNKVKNQVRKNELILLRRDRER